MTVKKYTYEEDVYSLGLLIYFIFFEKNPKLIEEERSKRTIYPFDEFTDEFSKLNNICTMCTHEKPFKRPKISEVIDLYGENAKSHMNKQTNDIELTDATNNYIKNKYFPYWKLFYENNNDEFQKQLAMFYSCEIINLNIRKNVEKYSNQINKIIEFSEHYLDPMAFQ